MDEEAKRKQEEVDKIRCANYLLQMIEKYGAKILEKRKKEKASEDS